MHSTPCGVRLVRDRDAVMPASPCCGAVADLDGTCFACGRILPVGYTLAALVGHRDFRRDLKSIVESIAECPESGACADRLAEHFGQECLTASPDVRMVVP